MDDGAFEDRIHPSAAGYERLLGCLQWATDAMNAERRQRHPGKRHGGGRAYYFDA